MEKTTELTNYQRITVYECPHSRKVARVFTLTGRLSFHQSRGGTSRPISTTRSLSASGTGDTQETIPSRNGDVKAAASACSAADGLTGALLPSSLLCPALCTAPWRCRQLRRHFLSDARTTGRERPRSSHGEKSGSRPRERRRRASAVVATTGTAMGRRCDPKAWSLRTEAEALRSTHYFFFQSANKSSTTSVFGQNINSQTFFFRM